MNHPPSLAHLHRKPVRPNKAQCGHSSGISPADTCINSGLEGGALAYPAIAPRLLDLEQTAWYLGVSPWTVRDLEAGGVLKRVCVPLPGGRELRKLLFDKADLDRLIEAWKDAGQ